MGSLVHDPVESLNSAHVYMVSFPGQGHVNPLLRLGKRLADCGLFITFCAPELAGESIRRANGIADDEPVPFGRGMIRFEFFDDGWDFNDANRNDLDEYLAQLDIIGRVKLPEMIRRQADLGRPVSCLVNNPFIPWVCDVAEELGIPSALLWIQSAACFSAYYHYFNKLVPFPSEEEPEIDIQLPCIPLLKHDEVPNFLRPNTPYPFLGRAILGQYKNMHKPFCVLMDTFQELEPEIINYMSKICRPIKPIGPLFKPLKGKNDVDSENCNGNGIRVDFFTPDSCIEWLDSKPANSVVYVSFGSVVHLKQEQIDEIGYGLLESDLPFLWVLRPPSKALNVQPHVLPEGFLEKVGDKGKIVQWCPQEEVLEHPSMALFLTHCGWNSTVEALGNGIPVAAFPFWGDQVTDAKFLVDVFKVGVRICRGEGEDRIIPRDEISKCLRSATEGTVAEELRENAAKWKRSAEAAVEEGGSSYRNMQEFVDEIQKKGGTGGLIGLNLKS